MSNNKEHTVSLTDQELSYLLDDLNVGDYKTKEQQKELLRLQEKLAEVKAGVIKEATAKHMCAQPAYYEINVSLKGIHLFATAPRSITTWKAMVDLYALLEIKFPKDEGYSIMVTARYEYGEILNV